MDNQESQLMLLNSDLESDPARVWLLAYADKQKFYLTDDERSDFLHQIGQGAMTVQIGTMTLSVRFLYMYQYKKKPVKREWKEVKDKDGNIVMQEV